MRRVWSAALAAILFCGLGLPLRAQDSPTDYRIAARDLLEIRVLEVPDLNGERRVDEAGSIDLPLIGAFKVAGLTILEVRAQLEDLLRTKYVNRATVSVSVKEVGSKPITVVGAVVKPGPLPVSSGVTLLQAIAAAGGIAPGAGKKIYVIRRADNGLSDVLEINSDRLLRDTNMMWNVPVHGSDVINIPPKSTVKVFCLGEVKNPGVLELDSDDRITLLSVIAKAGGFTDRASKTIRIKRRGPDGRDTELKVNYKDVLAGRVPDPSLKPDDVVIVEESFF